MARPIFALCAAPTCVESDSGPRDSETKDATSFVGASTTPIVFLPVAAPLTAPAHLHKAISDFC